MSDRTCSICSETLFSFGWCRKHYRRWRRWGDPLGGSMPQGLSDPERIEWHTRKIEDCWLWSGTVLANGYGHIYRKGGPVVMAHRLAYEVYVGPIPEGLTLDHLCRVRHCVNPAHLEPVTQRENTLRGTSPIAKNARKTHCKWGHEYTPENTYTDRRGRRSCKVCRRAVVRRAHAKRQRHTH